MDTRIQDHYKLRAQTVWRWHDHARKFICAANRLVDAVGAKRNLLVGPIPPEEHSYTSFESIMMLFGVAAENLLRALLIAKGTTPVSTDKLSTKLKSRNLVSFAEKAAITITQRERQLLKCLQNCVELGKYPIGTTATSGQGARILVHASNFEGTWALLQKLDDKVLEEGESPFDRVNVMNLGEGNLDDKGDWVDRP